MSIHGGGLPAPAGAGRIVSRTIVWFPLVAGCPDSEGSLADRRPERKNRRHLPENDADSPGKARGTRRAGGGIVPDDRGECGRADRHQAARQGRSAAVAHEQDADVDAAADAPDSVARAARQAESEVRANAERRPRRSRQARVAQGVEPSVLETKAMKRTGLIGLLTATVLAFHAPAQAQISDARVKELIKQAAENIGRDVPQVPSTQTAGQTRPVVTLTLEDAVKFALDRNLDIAVQRLNPEISDIAIQSIRSVYHPALTSTLSTQETKTPATSTLSGSTQVGAPVQNGVTNFNGGIAQSIPWGGGSFSVALNNNRQTTSSLNVLYKPTFNTNWSGVYTQPLLRGFKIDGTRQQLAVSKVNRDVSDVQLKATIVNTLSNVRNAYWDYVYATQAVEVAQQSVRLAEQLVKDNQTRVEVGTMAPIDVVQAQSQAATARQNLATAMQTMHTAELVLKRLIVSGTDDPNWSAQLDPVDRPEFRPEPIDIEAAVRRALSERTDYEIAKKNIQSNDVTLKFLRDQLLPQADFQATYGLAGIGGTQFQRASTGGLGGAATVVPGGFNDTLSALFNNRFPRWTFALNFSYPLGTSTQE